MPWRQSLAFLMRAVILGLAFSFVIITIWPKLVLERHLTGPDQQAQTPAQTASPTLPAGRDVSGPVSYSDAVDRASPAVVNINTAKVVTVRQHSFFDDPIFRRFFGRDLDNLIGKPRQQLQTSLGSGVLLSSKGYIVTNNHVIQGADTIQVSLRDGRTAKAKLVGSDPETDLAVLKIELDKLPSIQVGDSGKLRVGDVVLAIGNPFGVGQTVTLGIVSATGRNKLGINRFENFIQTDAAINAGNSGGALINANGDLIGISTRKLGANTGAQNIGFAIPVSLAKQVMEQIIEYGSVRRAWLGASFVDLRPTTQPDGSIARSGIAVGWVAEQGPAWQAGIRQGDVIVALDGNPVNDANQFELAISQREPGSRVELNVSRRLESFQTYATLIQQPPL